MKRLFLGPEEMRAGPGRVPSLDGLRGVSILIVIGCHFAGSRTLFGFSAFGVVIFFCISGFLITRLLLAEAEATGTIDIPAFYTRRILRLYPVVVTFLALALITQAARGLPIDWREAASALFYFVNYLVTWRQLHGVPIILPIGALWSLAVEEHFYIVMPFAIHALRRRPMALAVVALAVCAVSLLIRLETLLLHPELVGTLATYRRSETRFDAIAVGVLLAALAQTPSGQRLIVLASKRWASVAAIASLLASFIYRDEFFEGSFRFSVQSFALLPIFCNILFADSFRPIKALLNLPAMRWIGRLSYSLYVWHGGVGFFLGGLVAASPAVLHPLTQLTLSFALACLSYYLVERPVLDLRRSFGRRPKPRRASARQWRDA